MRESEIIVDNFSDSDNAVPPPFAEALVRANLPEMCQRREAA